MGKLKFLPAAVRQYSMYDIFAVFFVSFLLISNIGATKLIGIGPLVFDGGAILFPFTYIIGDILSEVYGFKKASRAIFLGFFVSILASCIFWLVIWAPADPSYTGQAAFTAVLGVVPRFVVASLCGYLVGQLLNSWVLVRIKNNFGNDKLWIRLISSTAVGELADTALFCIIAWIGVINWGTILNLLFTGYIYKVVIEVVLLPITYLVIAAVKRYEVSYQQESTSVSAPADAGEADGKKLGNKGAAASK